MVEVFFIALPQRIIELPYKKVRYKKNFSDLPTFFPNEAEIGNKTFFRP